MAEYIEKDAIVQKIKNRYLPRSVDPYSVNLYDAGVNTGLDLALGLIESAISADVVPVVHGKWIRLDMHRGLEQYKCSVCRSECYVPECMGEPMYEYCANCGARMDEVVDNGV